MFGWVAGASGQNLVSCADPEHFARGGPTLKTFFSF